MQILWSKSPLHTAELFRDIRKSTLLGGASTKDPDLQKIAKIGTVGDAMESGEGQVEEGKEDESDFKKYLPVEFLKKLPGVDSHSVNKIARNVRTVVDLNRMSEDDLKKLIGPKNGRELRIFLDKKIEVIRAQNDEIV